MKGSPQGQVWQVISTQIDPGEVLASVKNVPPALQGYVVRQVLDMAGYPYPESIANILPMEEPDESATLLDWDDLCDHARDSVSRLKNTGANTEGN